MKKILFIIFCLVYAVAANAQTLVYKQDCDFLNNLHFKNGVDTIVVLGYKTGIVKVGPPLPSLSKLVEDKTIPPIKVRLGVSFKPLNCSEETTVDCIDTNHFAYTIHENDNTTLVQIRCIVFEGYTEFSKQYFIIDKILPYKP